LNDFEVKSDLMQRDSLLEENFILFTKLEAF